MYRNIKINKSNTFLTILLGICICIFLQGIVFPSLQISAWDKESSSITEFLDLDDDDPSSFVLAKFYSQANLFKSLISSLHFNDYLLSIPQIVHGRSPPLV